MDAGEALKIINGICRAPVTLTEGGHTYGSFIFEVRQRNEIGDLDLVATYQPLTSGGINDGPAQAFRWTLTQPETEIVVTTQTLTATLDALDREIETRIHDLVGRDMRRWPTNTYYRLDESVLVAGSRDDKDRVARLAAIGRSAGIVFVLEHDINPRHLAPRYLPTPMRMQLGR